MTSEVLVLGAESSGKTVFIRRLLEISNIANAATLSTSTIIIPKIQISSPLDLAAIPTIGVDITNIAISNDKTLILREIGSALASKYDVYLPQAQAIIYLIDAADIGSTASAMILLYEILSYKQCLSNKTIAIIMNKIDLCDHGSTIAQMIRLESIKTKCQENSIQIIEYSGSSTDYEIASKVFEWLYALARRLD